MSGSPACRFYRLEGELSRPRLAHFLFEYPPEESTVERAEILLLFYFSCGIRDILKHHQIKYIGGIAFSGSPRAESPASCLRLAWRSAASGLPSATRWPCLGRMSDVTLEAYYPDTRTAEDEEVEYRWVVRSRG